MKEVPIEIDIQLDNINPVDFFGVNNSNLDIIKQAYPDLKIIARGTTLRTYGSSETIYLINQLINGILDEIKQYGPVDEQRIKELLNISNSNVQHTKDFILNGVSGQAIRARTPGQYNIIHQIEKQDVVFAIGPAGSGKTYTAVALAVKALKNKTVRKIILVRPAVEAGESLGFLPGDYKEKIDPYLRPLYDALEEMIHPEKLKSFIEKNIIEIVPLAFMRGRTLNNAFIILDEAQNATEMQLKMFLTRMGMGSKIVVTGDITQIDLPRSARSGLIHCKKILYNIDGIGFVFLTDRDVIRHPIIKKIIEAYEYDQNKKNNES